MDAIDPEWLESLHEAGVVQRPSHNAPWPVLHSWTVLGG